MGKVGKGISIYYLIISAIWIISLYFTVCSEFSTVVKITGLLATLLLTFIIGLMAHLQYHGLFTEVKVSCEPHFPGRYLVYKTLNLDYYSIDSEFTSLETTIKQHATLSKYLLESKAFLCGIYYTTILNIGQFSKRLDDFQHAFFCLCPECLFS